MERENRPTAKCDISLTRQVSIKSINIENRLICWNFLSHGERRIVRLDVVDLITDLRPDGGSKFRTSWPISGHRRSVLLSIDSPGGAAAAASTACAVQWRP